MTGWGAASVALKIALFVHSLALLIFVIGFSTKEWATVENRQPGPSQAAFETAGLWQYEFCYKNPSSYNGPWQYYMQLCVIRDIGKFINGLRCGDWYHGVQAVECLGLTMMVAAVILLFLYFFAPSMKQKKYLYIIIALTFGAGVSILIGAVVYGHKIHEYETRTWDIGKPGFWYPIKYKVSWSFGLAVAGALLGFGAGIAEIVELRKCCQQFPCFPIAVE